MSEKSTFHETKEVVSRLREPLKIKAVPYATTKVRGHQIQVEMNLGWGEIDSMKPEIQSMVENMIEMIEGPMQSEYLGKIEQVNEV
jgi:choline kinase